MSLIQRFIVVIGKAIAISALFQLTLLQIMPRVLVPLAWYPCSILSTYNGDSL